MLLGGKTGKKLGEQTDIINTLEYVNGQDLLSVIIIPIMDDRCPSLSAIYAMQYG